MVIVGLAFCALALEDLGSGGDVVAGLVDGTVVGTLGDITGE